MPSLEDSLASYIKAKLQDATEGHFYKAVVANTTQNVVVILTLDVVVGIAGLLLFIK